MDANSIRIGYVPYLPDLSQPADRRRFPYFATRHHISFEIADKNKSYDVILLNASANLSQWLIYKKRHPGTKFIFEMVDSLIFSFNLFTALFKGIGWFLLRKESRLYLSHRKLILKWLKSADLVLCSSTELKNIISRWNDQIFVTPDYLQNEYRVCKADYTAGEKFKLVWEGQAIVLRHFLSYRNVLQSLSAYCELHVITNEKYPMFGQLVRFRVQRILRRLPIKTVFHRWDLARNCEVFSQCDCGMIPLDPRHTFGWHKPGNKLVSFWFTGLPTVVSATPAYRELMDRAGERWYCDTAAEWLEKIRAIRAMTPEERKRLALFNLAFAEKNFSDRELDATWFAILEKITEWVRASSVK